MATGQLGRVVDRLRRFVGGRKDSDARLLADFLRDGSESAFEAIVQRHGPMVLAVCRRVLANASDAEDAFQATFLVFVRKAASISKRASLASWLHGVAYRTALKARTLSAQRRFHERRALPMTGDDSERQAAIRELRPVLDEELAGLPAKYREPLVLSYLEGKSKEEIAQQLGWPHGTVSGRLARARDVLRGRLIRRGLALPSVGFAFVLTKASASAAVPAPLLASTFRAASVFAAGNLAAGGVPASVATLTQGVLHTMMMTKLRLAVVLTAVAGLVLTGVGAIAYHGWAGEPSGTKATLAQTGEKKAAGKEKAEPDSIVGVWHIVDAERSGKKPEGREKDEMAMMQFTFTKDSLSIGAGGVEAAKFTCTFDGSQKPSTITLARSDKKETVTGIYELKGNSLKLCISDAGPQGAAPTEFKTKEGDRNILFVLQRGEGKKVSPEDAAKVKEAANRAISQNNLKQIALAFHNYHDTYKAFPAGAIYSKDGKPLLSWRVAILPWLEQDNLYKQFKLDEPWDSENNKRLIAQMPRVYALPGKKTDAKDVTFYRVFTGKDTMFPGPKGMSLTRVTDGTSNTLLVVEAADSCVWTKPDELAYADNAALPKLGGYFTGGFNVAFCDGSVRFVTQDVDEKMLRLFIKPNDGNVVNFDALDPKKK
jgi:RNA polymerase sigma factor (sigma-70 family)